MFCTTHSAYFSHLDTTKYVQSHGLSTNLLDIFNLFDLLFNNFTIIYNMIIFVILLVNFTLVFIVKKKCIVQAM